MAAGSWQICDHENSHADQTVSTSEADGVHRMQGNVASKLVAVDKFKLNATLIGLDAMELDKKAEVMVACCQQRPIREPTQSGAQTTVDFVWLLVDPRCDCFISLSAQQDGIDY